MTSRLKSALPALAVPTLALIALAGHAWGGQLLAGASKAAITPAADEFPYQALNEKPFVGVHDDIFARALALDDSDGHKAVIVSIEVTAIPDPEAVTAAVARATGLPAGDILVVATHTHGVPLTFFHSAHPNATEQREIERIKTQAASVAADAQAHMRPATIGFVRGQAFVNTNNGEQAGRKFWYDPIGSSDKTLDILRIDGTDGKPVALMLNYASHGEVMFRSVTKDGGYEVTGDLPGAVSRILETKAAGAPVVLFTAAAEGDQLPLFKSLQPDAELPGTDEGAAGWGLLDLQARRLATAAIDTLATAPAATAQVHLSMATGSVSCPGQHYNVDRETHKLIGIDDTAPVTIPVAVLRLNDIVLNGIGADLASDIGRAVKAASPQARTSILTMTSGSVGYVLNDAAYQHPTHGVMGSPVKPGCAAPALSAELNSLLAKPAR
jgi:hypothetical protein